MTVPRTRTRPTSTPAKPLTPLKLEIPPEGVETTVTQNADGSQSFEFDATVKPNETNDQTEDINLQDLLDGTDSPSETPFTDIPKTALEKMFDDLRHGVKNHNIYDQFYANITRLPDSMTDRFTVPCRDQIPGYVIQFNTSDQFNFIPALQEANNNSGGRFNIRVYDINQQPLEIPNPLTYERTMKPIVLGNLYIPNPPPKPIAENAQNPNTMLISALEKMEQRQREFEQRMINQKPEKSTLEIAMEQKMVDMIINGNQNNDSGSGFVKEVMMMPIVMQEFATTMREAMKKPDPIPVGEATTADKVLGFLETPTGAKMADRAGEMLERLPGALMLLGANKNGQPIPQPMPQPQPPEQQNPQIIDMQTEEEETPAEALMNDILNELDSDNVIDETNLTIQDLGATYPAETTMLVGLCKFTSFEQVIEILQIKFPFAFEGMYDFGIGDNSQPTATLNELGKRRFERLKEFYEFVKKQD